MNVHASASQNSQKGEVAWLLTIVSMLTIVVGLVIGLSTATSPDSLTRTSEAADGTYKGMPITRVDGLFISTGDVCGASFDTQVDPKVEDIIISRPPTLGWPVAGADMFSVVEDGGVTGLRGLSFLKNQSFRVRFNPSDTSKGTPDPRDILITYQVPSQPVRRFVVPAAKVPSWVQDSDTQVFIVWSHSSKREPTPSFYSFTSALSKGCGTITPTVTPTGTITPTVTPTGTITPTVTPTGTITPTATPPITSRIGACYDICSTSAQCGRHVDPTTNIEQQMLCLETRRTPGGTTPFSGELGTNYFMSPGTSGFSLFADDPYPYASNAFVRGTGQGPAALPYINGLKVRNETTYDLKELVPGSNPPRYISQLSWSTGSVPPALRDKVYDITLEFPTSSVEYEVTDQFCDDLTGSSACVEHNAYIAANPSARTSRTFSKIRIRSGAVVNYGWVIRVKPDPTAVPTNRPTNAPTATPTPRPTTIPTPTGPLPEACGVIHGKVSATVIAQALANPGSIPGWGLQDPTRPEGPTNPFRRSLTLQVPANPYHPTLNQLVYRASCATPTTAPTVRPTAGPSVVPTTGPTAGPTGIPGGHAICDPTRGVECRCMPPSCTGRDCSSKELACERPTPTPSETPTPTTISAAKCVYNALAFVEQCQSLNPNTGDCMPILGTSRLDAYPVNATELARARTESWRRWAPLNNRQDRNPGREDASKPAENQQFQHILRSVPAFDQLLDIFKLFNFARNNTEGIAVSPRQRSEQDVLVNNAPRQLIQPRSDIRIGTKEEIQRGIPASFDINDYVPAEQYENMENASVKLFYNQDDYRIVPNGKNIYSCTNAIARKLQDDGELNPATDRDIIKMTSGIGACNLDEFNGNVARDTIDGLTVGCGQDIVYGWTLQKCSFNYDYVFVVDTSTTMGKVDPNLGIRKIDGAMDQIDAFINEIERNGSDSRVSLINYNNAVHVYPSNGTIGDRTRIINGTNGFGQGVQTPLLPRTQFDEVRARFPFMRKTVEEGGVIEKGSCMKCGLDLAWQVLSRRSEEEKQTRHGVVIFLSDGLPNSYAGDADPSRRNNYPPEARNNVEPWGWAGIYEAADNLRDDGYSTPGEGVRVANRLNPSVFDDVLLVPITYGDSSKATDEGQNFSAFTYSIASLRNNDLNSRWAYSTDPDNAAPMTLGTVFSEINRTLNTCALATLAFDISMRARDVNQDGVVNLIDLFRVYEAQQQKGTNLDEDIDANGTVNSLDISLVLNSIGTVVTDVVSSPVPTPAE